MKEKITPEEEYEFWITMFQVIKKITKVKENELSSTGISPIQSGVLYLLKTAKKPLSPSQIAHRLLRAPPTIHQLLDRMENQELVKRVRSTEGKRGVQVVMTSKGEDAYRKQTKAVAILKILRTLSDKERQQLKIILTKLLDAADRELAFRPYFL